MGKYGQKYICTECNCKFYDLGRQNPVCPKCGTEPKKMSGKQLSRIEVSSKSTNKKDVIEDNAFLEGEGEIEMDDNLWDSIEDVEEDPEF